MAHTNLYTKTIEVVAGRPKWVKGQFSGEGLNPCKPDLGLTHLISNYITKELILAEQRVETVSVLLALSLYL